jgi:hypothetical protein
MRLQLRHTLVLHAASAAWWWLASSRCPRAAAAINARPSPIAHAVEAEERGATGQ